MPIHSIHSKTSKHTEKTMNNTITVNGKEYPFSEGSTLASVLDELEIIPKHMAIEHNAEIVPADAIQERSVQTGDIIEIIQFVGGG